MTKRESERDEGREDGGRRKGEGREEGEEGKGGE